MKKRLLPLLIAALIALTACSGGSSAKPEDEPEEEENYMSDMVFNMWSQVGNTLGVKEGTMLYDCVFARLKDIEQQYKCEIRVTPGKEASVMTSNIASGMSLCDIVYMAGDNPLFVAANGDLLYPLTELKDIIDYEDSAKYGNPGTLECAMKNGVPYAVQPCYWPAFQDCFLPCVVYNRDILSEANLTDLHEYYEKKSWTWDTFRDVVANYNISTDDGYVAAMSSHAGMFLTSVLYSNGFKLIDYIDGELKIATGEQNVVDALTWAHDLYEDYGEKMLSTEYWGDEQFLNGEAYMHIVMGNGLIQSDIMYKSDILTSIMPFPCGPAVKYGQWASWSEGILGYAIPVDAAYPEGSATIISTLFEPFEEFGGTGGLASYLTENVFTDAIDTEIYLELGKYTRYSYWNVSGSNFMNRARDKFRSSSAMEIIEKNGQLDKDAIDKYIKGNYENYIYDHLYGDKAQ